MDESLSSALGQEAGIRALVDRFYGLMDSLPEVGPLRGLHPEDLAGPREKLFLFLVGWTDGPDLYVEKFGHPRLRARHLPFAISDLERDQWMVCMRKAVEEVALPPTARDAVPVSEGALAEKPLLY